VTVPTKLSEGAAPIGARLSVRVEHNFFFLFLSDVELFHDPRGQGQPTVEETQASSSSTSSSARNAFKR